MRYLFFPRVVVPGQSYSEGIKSILTGNFNENIITPCFRRLEYGKDEIQ